MLKDHRKAGLNVYQQSIEAIANILAAIIAFWLTPVVYGQTIVWVSQLTERSYGVGYVDLAEFVWFVLVALLLFYMSRVATSIIIIMGGLYLAMRFL